MVPYIKALEKIRMEGDLGCILWKQKGYYLPKTE